MMEWATIQHLDLRHVGRSRKPLQPHAAAFHPNQAIVAVAIGNYIIGELDLSVCLIFLERCFVIEFVCIRGGTDAYFCFMDY